MIPLVIAIHVTVCIALVVVVLLQKGKGANIGAVFGGSSQTVFGASGAGNLLTRITGLLAVIFFLTSIFLAYTSTQRVTGSIFEGSAPPVPLPAPESPAGAGAKAPPAAPAGHPGAARPVPAKK